MATSSVPNPIKKKVDDIKSLLLQPALTSHYELYLPPPNAPTFSSYMSDNGINYLTEQSKIQLSCSEATLPGSSLATLEINNDYTGVTERHAYRRLYDDRIDLSFYVDSTYSVIRFFEYWIKYIVSESIAGGPNGRSGLESPNYFYTVRYPEEYRTNFSITKFERDYKNKLIYTFLNAYPISLSSIPISYDSSSLLKCTVSFSYVRYYVQSVNGAPPSVADDPQSTLNNPLTQSQFNTDSYNSFVNPEFQVDTNGAISFQTALSSGNSVQYYENDEIVGAINANQTIVESGLPYVGRNVGPLNR